jgi:hypothetical protein
MPNRTPEIWSRPLTKKGRDNWERIFGDEVIEDAIHDAHKSNKKAKCQSKPSQS